jgi:hypothetical protein
MITSDAIRGPTRAARASVPPLDDPRLYRKRADVAILDAHDGKAGGTPVTVADLHTIAEINNKRCARGDYAVVTIGHTDDGPEEGKQPPPIGIAKNFDVGPLLDDNGRLLDQGPFLLCDLYINAERYAEAMTYPRRSVELWRGKEPAQNYVDIISLLRRTPRRDLGLVTSYAMPPRGAAGMVKEYYSLAPRTPMIRSTHPMSTIARLERYANRSADLMSLESEGLEFEFMDEAGRLFDLPEPAYRHELRMMKDRYRRAPLTPGARIEVSRRNDLTREQMEDMVRLAASEGITNGEEALERYQRAQAGGLSLTRT